MIATMEAVVVAEHEWSVLQMHKAKSPYKLMRRKSEAILMLLEGVGVDLVARLVERATRTVVEWARDWRRDRLSSIRTGHADNNNASKISPEQEKEILEALSPPLPCWWSRVVRGWASRCGHDVLPLYVDDPGGVVTRGGRAPVTADKGNDPLRVRSSVTWVRDRSSTGWSSPT